MLKSLLRLTGIFIIIFAFTISYIMACSYDSRYPLGTNSSIIINLKDSQLSKLEFINILNNFAKDNNINIYKSSIDNLSPQNKCNLLIFGEEKYDQVQWLNLNLSGVFIPASKITTEPLDGIYSFFDNDGAIGNRLQNKLSTHNINISIYRKNIRISDVLSYITHTSSGLSLLSLLILLNALSLAWFTAKKKSRYIRLISGISKIKIHFQDFNSYIQIISIPAIVCMLGILLIWSINNNSISSLNTILPIFTTILILMIIFIILSIVSVSILTNINIYEFAARKSNDKKIYLIGAFIKLCTFIVIAISIPIFLNNSSLAIKASRQLQSWSDISDSYTLSLNQDIYIDQNENKIRQSINSINNYIEKNDILLSVSLETILDIPSEIKDTYDSFILCNREYLNTVNCPPLSLINSNNFNTTYFDFIQSSLNFWAKSKNTPINFDLYEIQDDLHELSPLVYGVKVGISSTPKNPLLIVIENPLLNFDPIGLTIPLIVNGNILFKNYTNLTTALDKSGFSKYIAGIDNAASIMLEKAQTLKQEAYLGLIGIIFLIITLLTSTIQSATIWTYKYRQQLFLSRTYGHNNTNLAIKPALFETIFAILSCLLSSTIILNLDNTISIISILLTCLIFISLYFFISLSSYTLQTKNMIRLMIMRKS